jgi:hypothetical protein
MELEGARWVPFVFLIAVYQWCRDGGAGLVLLCTCQWEGLRTYAVGAGYDVAMVVLAAVRSSATPHALAARDPCYTSTTGHNVLHLFMPI